MLYPMSSSSKGTKLPLLSAKASRAREDRVYNGTRRSLCFLQQATVTCSSIQISGLPGDGGYVHGASSTTSTGGHGLGNGNSPWTDSFTSSTTPFRSNSLSSDV